MTFIISKVTSRVFDQFRRHPRTQANEFLTQAWPIGYSSRTAYPQNGASFFSRFSLFSAWATPWRAAWANQPRMKLEARAA